MSCSARENKQDGGFALDRDGRTGNREVWGRDRNQQDGRGKGLKGEEAGGTPQSWGDKETLVALVAHKLLVCLLRPESH